MGIKRTRTITHKVVTNRIRIGGDERDKKPIWERLLSIILEKLPLTGSWDRTTERTTIEETFESEGDFITTTNEQAEARLEADAQRALESEAVVAERKQIAKGADNETAILSDPKETAQAMRELAKELESMRAEGYWIRLEEIPTDVVQESQQKKAGTEQGVCPNCGSIEPFDKSAVGYVCSDCGRAIPSPQH